MLRVRNLVNTTTTTTTTVLLLLLLLRNYDTHMHVHVHVAEREWYVKGRRAGFKKRNEKREEKEIQKKRSTGPSRVVPHRSTTPARTCLTSLFGWEAVSQADMAAHAEDVDLSEAFIFLVSSAIPSWDPPCVKGVPKSVPPSQLSRAFVEAGPDFWRNRTCFNTEDSTRKGGTVQLRKDVREYHSSRIK